MAPAHSTHAPKSRCPQYHRIFVRPGGLVDRLQALTKKVRPRPCLWCVASLLPLLFPAMGALDVLKNQAARSSTVLVNTLWMRSVPIALHPCHIVFPAPCSMAASRCPWPTAAASWGSKWGPCRSGSPSQPWWARQSRCRHLKVGQMFWHDPAWTAKWRSQRMHCCSHKTHTCRRHTSSRLPCPALPCPLRRRPAQRGGACPRGRLPRALLRCAAEAVR